MKQQWQRVAIAACALSSGVALSLGAAAVFRTAPSQAPIPAKGGQFASTSAGGAGHEAFAAMTLPPATTVIPKTIPSAHAVPAIQPASAIASASGGPAPDAASLASTSAFASAFAAPHDAAPVSAAPPANASVSAALSANVWTPARTGSPKPAGDAAMPVLTASIAMPIPLPVPKPGLIMTSALPAAPLENRHREMGMASFYFGGGRTASGTIAGGMTAAHRKLPFGSRVKVRDLKTGKEVVVTITDRGPFKHNRVIDLSDMAARELGITGRGIARVEVVALAD